VIVEVKTQLLDLQDLFGSLSVKERLAATIAERRGWKASRCVRCSRWQTRPRTGPWSASILRCSRTSTHGV
jgi:hypothetical protein